MFYLLPRGPCSAGVDLHRVAAPAERLGNEGRARAAEGLADPPRAGAGGVRIGISERGARESVWIRPARRHAPSVRAEDRDRHSSDWAMPSGSGSRDKRIHKSFAVVTAPTLDRAARPAAHRAFLDCNESDAGTSLGIAQPLREDHPWTRRASPPWNRRWPSRSLHPGPLDPTRPSPVSVPPAAKPPRSTRPGHPGSAGTSGSGWLTPRTPRTSSARCSAAS